MPCTLRCNTGRSLLAEFASTFRIISAGLDDDGAPVSDDDDAVVTITDTPSEIEIIKTADPITVAEPGGPVTFSFTINNLSAVDSVTIDTLTDTIHGDLNGQGDCAVPQTIAAGGSYSCSFTADVLGNFGYVETNVVTASGLDDDGAPVSDDDDAVVTITDVVPTITVDKVADQEQVFAPGEDVAFTLLIDNDTCRQIP
jgi:hypothetical protein